MVHSILYEMYQHPFDFMGRFLVVWFFFFFNIKFNKMKPIFNKKKIKFYFLFLFLFFIMNPIHYNRVFIWIYIKIYYNILNY